VKKGADRRETRGDRQRAEAARVAMRRALWRLSVLEYLILVLALLLALAGGALVAWILETAASFPFRWTWGLTSLLLFIVPGGSVYLRELRRGGSKESLGEKSEPKDPHG
jgi:predicted lysophospholipase L1 biosynthesis ABC-type transport system permease subunit